jgi:hypothetical protein
MSTRVVSAQETVGTPSAAMPEEVKKTRLMKSEPKENAADMSPFRTKPVQSAVAQGPAIAVDATDVHVGRVELGDNIVCTFGVRNVGKQELTLVATPG